MLGAAKGSGCGVHSACPLTVRCGRVCLGRGRREREVGAESPHLRCVQRGAHPPLRGRRCDLTTPSKACPIDRLLPTRCTPPRPACVLRHRTAEANAEAQAIDYRAHPRDRAAAAPLRPHACARRRPHLAVFAARLPATTHTRPLPALPPKRAGERGGTGDCSARTLEIAPPQRLFVCTHALGDGCLMRLVRLNAEMR